ncbi:MAG: flavodoxin-dependent (E)-4-hydroxy-3-methylbut-2-enyl-diphosphate synthase [Magnetococcales bacterium]|nr:flavodoxin-dependent (E)-4-hydroxy-3-methylbut-2-enyl-diphosphate synthase [Magnetococcales bacterium]
MISGLVQPRRTSRPVRVGSIVIGGDAPISVQSMTNTDTRDIAATSTQINALAKAGADLVRISCPDQPSAEAIATLKQLTTVPLIADIHFDHKIALTAIHQGIDGLRINPGNIGTRERITQVVQAARERQIPIRIGVNAGSLERDILAQYGEPCPEAMVASALRHIRILQDLDYHEIKISLKASRVDMMVAAYRLLAAEVDYPLHLGVTEAGGLVTGSVKSAIGIGLLLAQGIGDTLRVSLSTDPVEEVRVGFEILKALGLRSRGVNIISCPTCARQQMDVIGIVSALEQQLGSIDEPMTISIIGCVVNGPGEAKECDIGLVGGEGGHLLYRHGQPVGKTGPGREQVIDTVLQEITSVIHERKLLKQ